VLYFAFAATAIRRRVYQPATLSVAGTSRREPRGSRHADQATEAIREASWSRGESGWWRARRSAGPCRSGATRLSSRSARA